MSEILIEIKIQSWIAIICAIVAIFKLKDLQGQEIWIPVLLVINIIADFFAAYMVSSHFKSNIIVYHILWPIESAISLYFLRKLEMSKLLKSLWPYFIIGSLLTGIINVLYLQDKLQVTGWYALISGIVLLILSYYLLRKIIAGEGFKRNEPLHWFLIATLLYNLLAVQGLAGSMAMWQFNQPDISLAFFSLNIIAYVIWSIIITTGIYLKNGK